MCWWPLRAISSASLLSILRADRSRPARLCFRWYRARRRRLFLSPWTRAFPPTPNPLQSQRRSRMPRGISSTMTATPTVAGPLAASAAPTPQPAALRRLCQYRGWGSCPGSSGRCRPLPSRAESCLTLSSLTLTGRAAGTAIAPPPLRSAQHAARPSAPCLRRGLLFKSLCPSLPSLDRK